MADFNSFGKDLIRIRKELSEFVNEELPDLAEMEMSRIVHDSFEKEQYQGKPGAPRWDARKSDDSASQNRTARRGLLVDSNDLQQSMQTAVSKGQVKLESNVDYAVIHNEGGTVSITVTPEARKFFWAMYYKTKEERFKAMALSPKNSFKITIPQRQFAPIQGEELPAMDKFIEDEMDKKMDELFNK